MENGNQVFYFPFSILRFPLFKADFHTAQGLHVFVGQFEFDAFWKIVEILFDLLQADFKFESQVRLVADSAQTFNRIKDARGFFDRRVYRVAEFAQGSFRFVVEIHFA